MFLLVLGRLASLCEGNARAAFQNPAVARVQRSKAGLQVVARVKDAAAPARYEGLMLLRPDVDDETRAKQIDELKARGGGGD